MSINYSACLTNTVQMFVEITVIPFFQYYSFIFLSTEFCTGMHVGGGVINLCHLRYVVVQLVEALLYKLESCRFNSRWCRSFSLT